MNGGPLWFPAVAHKDRAFDHHLEEGPFHSYFIFYSILGPFLRANEDLGRSREVVDFFKNNIFKFTCVVFQVQDDSAYTLGLDDTPNAIDFCIITFF